MANKVYLLTCVFLEEHCTLAAFSTREAADAALRYGGNESAIEEFELDPQLPTAPEGHSIWIVTMEGPEEPTATRLHAFDLYGLDRVLVDDEEHIVEVWALDEQHAIRLGTERIEQYKREQIAGV